MIYGTAQAGRLAHVADVGMYLHGTIHLLVGRFERLLSKSL